MIRNWLVVAGVVALSVPGIAVAAELRQQSSRDWDARGLERVEVENPSGDVTVRPSRDGQVHLVALKIVRNSDQSGAATLSRDTQVLADLNGRSLLIKVRYPSRREIHLNLWDLMKHLEWPEVDVRLALELPAGLGLALRSTSGDLQTSALTGAQEIHTSSGDVDVSKALGTLWIESRSGDVTADNVAGASINTSSGNVIVGSTRGAIAIETHSGDVRIDSAVDSVTVITGSGEVRVGLARGGLNVRTGSGDVIARAAGHVHVETSSGEAKVALTPPLRAAELETGSGDVMLRIAEPIEFRIDAEAGSGGVEVNLPLISRSSRDHHVVGRVGRGSSAIVIRTASGSINVAR